MAWTHHTTPSGTCGDLTYHVVKCSMVGQLALVKYPIHHKGQISHYGHRGFDITVFFSRSNFPGWGKGLLSDLSL